MNTPVATETAAEPSAPRVRWNVDHLKSSYVNFANANSTQEEVVLNFGMNSNWDRGAGEVEIELTHRIVMSPFAAKRLAELMNKLVAQYESRYGKMK
jgi:hypothetical protein